MEFQARLIDFDCHKNYDIPIEADTPARALLRAHQARNFIQSAKKDEHYMACDWVSEVLRHKDGIIEYRPIYSNSLFGGFLE
jgi:hypothetical protein